MDTIINCPQCGSHKIKERWRFFRIIVEYAVGSQLISWMRNSVYCRNRSPRRYMCKKCYQHFLALPVGRQEWSIELENQHADAQRYRPTKVEKKQK